MSDIRTPLITNDPFSAWGTEVRDSVREKALTKSNELNVSSNPFGTYIGLRDEQMYQPYQMQYKGEYDPTAAYCVGNVVRVLPGKTYDLPWDSTPSKINIGAIIYGLPALTPVIALIGKIGGKDWVTYNYIPIPGTYICSVNVPSLYFTLGYGRAITGIGLLIEKEKAKSLSGYNSFVQNNIESIRFTDINYYPVWPELPNLSKIDSANVGLISGRYWDLMSLLPTTTYLCNNGMASYAVTDTQTLPSGSMNYTGSI